MSTKITAANGVELEVCQLGIDATNTNPTEPSSIWARLTPEQRVALAEALNPASAPYTPGGQWTRDDLPSPADVRWERTAETWKWRPNPTTDHVLDAVVAHLNAHHPKAGMEARLDAEVTGAEMTAAYAARDAAKRRCDELRSLIAGQSVNVDIYREKVREAERQRDEAHTAYEKAARERDEAVARADAAERERDRWKAATKRALEHRDEWKARAEKAGGVGVSRADIEKAALEAVKGTCGVLPLWMRDIITAVWALHDGSDPAVHVVRESDLPDLEMVAARNFDLANYDPRFRDATADEVAEVEEEVASDLRYILAARRAIEAEQAADPVEEKAEELMRVLAPETEDRTWGILTEPAREDFRRLARHVLGQEADQ